MAPRAKLSDVARLAGVSTATVSRVLNDNDRVAPDLVERVMKAKAELGYRYNSLARGLRRRANTVVGVVIPDVTNPFFTDLVRGIEDLVRENGYLLVLCNTDETAEKEAAYLELLIDQQVAGLVIAPVRSAVDAAAFDLTGIPVVAVDRTMSGVDTVTLDNVRGAIAVTSRLLESASRVATITGPLVTTTGSERLIGYRRALRDAGLPFEPELFVEADYSEPGGYLAAKRLLALPDRPQAIFCGNHAMALGAMRAIAEVLDDPDAIALASFEPLPWAADPRGRIVTLAVPSYELGQQAARMLLERIHGFDGPARTVVVETELLRSAP
ncbi:LacI family DNA-binding transcriptional regulator [Glaciibacter sp. 2TAF33]|uniref:LacI family DNA-binding transcriptional regulator n=1 Tax=Glaciibacter sp. 2TAF33 TaxID=3233015 RepID=UPI003F917143